MPSRRDSEAKLLEIIERTVKQGGKCLIPSFAVGRAQEIMAILGSNGLEHPVWMEGMLWDATAIHTAYPEYLSRYLQKNIFHRGNNPFLSKIFHRVAPKERNGIIDSSEPGVIIATSGMLIGGPAVEYLKGLAPDKKNTLVFVGYQAEGTMGRKIQRGWNELSLNERGNPNGFVTMLEDLHWVDPASEAFIAAYVDAIATSPGLLLLNFRPEYRADWMQKTWYQQLPLDPLGEDAIRDLNPNKRRGRPRKQK